MRIKVRRKDELLGKRKIKKADRRDSHRLRYRKKKNKKRRLFGDNYYDGCDIYETQYYRNFCKRNDIRKKDDEMDTDGVFFMKAA